MNDYDPIGGGFIVEQIFNFFSGSTSGGIDPSNPIFVILAVLKVIGVVFLLLFITGIVYVILQLRKNRPNYRLKYSAEHMPQDKVVKKRWEEIMNRFRMGTESDWRLAVIEADSLVDGVFKRMGFEGDSLAERMGSISPQELQTLADLKEAHRMRNNLVHTTGFKVSQQDAERTLGRYEKVLEEMEMLQ